MTEEQKRFKIKKKKSYEEEISELDKKESMDIYCTGILAATAIYSVSPFAPDWDIINNCLMLLTATGASYSLKKGIDAVSRKTMLQGKIEDINMELEMDKYARSKSIKSFFKEKMAMSRYLTQGSLFMTEEQKRFKIKKKKSYEEEISELDKRKKLKIITAGILAANVLFRISPYATYSSELMNTLLIYIESYASLILLDDIMEAIRRKTMLQGKIEDIKIELGMDKYVRSRGIKR